MVGAVKISQRRRGQRICRTGVTQDEGPASWSAGSRRASQWTTRASVWRRKESPGWERSRPLDQRRSVEESGTRSGSLSVGVACSQE